MKLQPARPGGGHKPMNFQKLFAALIAACLLLMTRPAFAQEAPLRFRASQVPVGKVFHFIKSNRDGSHAAQISVFVAAQDRLEALKWDQGGDEATLVVAAMDWSKFSVRHFEASHLSRDAAPELRATLEVSGDQLSMSLMEAPLTLHHWPWHSFDFDFTSLNMTLPHLRNPESGLTFWRTDFVYSEPPAVAELGEVRLTFEANEVRDGKRVRRYSIGGAGLGNTRGTWWADRRTGLLVEFEIPIGDEPGYNDVRLKATGSQKMSAAAWETFKRRSVAAR
ncbi:MAG: hypothetical protein ABI821_07795 [Pseudomonadota bacterium]